MLMNGHPEYPDYSALLKSIHDVGSYGGGEGGRYTVDEHISSIQDRRPSKSNGAKVNGQKNQDKVKANKDRSPSSVFKLNNQINPQDVEKGSASVIVQVRVGKRSPFTIFDLVHYYW